MSSFLLSRAAKIKLLILDVDGVLTDGRLYIGNAGEELKAFHIQDGLGMQLLMKTGVEIAVITGKASEIVTRRMQDLGVKRVFQKQLNKLPAYEKLLSECHLHPEQVSHVGDDLPDLPLIQRVGLGIAVRNATEAVKQRAHWTTTRSGGKGAVREVCDFIMQAQGTLDIALAKFLDTATSSHV